MKKTRLFLAILLLIVAAATLTIVATGAMSARKESPQEFLLNAGFRNIPSNITPNNVAYWKTHYNLNYFSYADMDKIMKANGFLVGPSNSYLGTIPDKNAGEIMANYIRIKDEIPAYHFFTHFRWTSDSKSGEFIGCFSKKELKGKAIRHTPAFDSHGWGMGSREEQERSISRFVKKDALMSKGIPTNMQNFMMREDYSFERIYIIAPASKFDTTHMDIGPQLAAMPTPTHRSSDPLAVVKTEKGWVVLSAWK